MLQLHIISLLFIVYFVCAGWAEPELEQPSYLEISSVDQNTSEGLIVKGVNDNLTLSCALLRGGKQLPVSSMNLQWSIPRQDANRSSTWVDGGALWLSITKLTTSDAGQYMCLEKDNQVALAHVALVVRAKGPYPYPHCSSVMMFLCEKGNRSAPGAKCIPYSFLCDGRPDCPNGHDETRDTCHTDDPCQGKLMCDDGRCIPREWCCDTRNVHSCFPHSCCPQIAIVERTGGGLRSGRGRENNKSQSLLQTTLYTVSVCLMIFLIAVTLLISAICKARLKRATHYSATLQGGQGDVPPEGSASPSPPSDWGYTRVPNSDAYNPQLIDSPRMVCPTYSEINNSTVCNVRQDSAELPSYFEIASENQQINGINNVSSSPQARRPTDFGMSTLANAIFNARYRPVPQEIVTSSFNNNDISDSDSSCRSPGSHTFNIYTSPARRNNNFASPRRNNESFDSPLNRFGETPEAYLTRRSAEQRRLRRANALDRILDRFGLNAPYAVERESSQSQPSGSENVDTPLSPENENLNGRRQFVSSILGRLRNSFNRTPRVPETTEVQEISTSTQVESRRRPDTPNVLELSLEEMDLARSGNGNDTYTLNGRTIHLLGASFEERPDLYSLGLQGLYIVDGIVENLNRFVSCPVLPPPYSEVANAAPSKVLGPPPPYVSRENLTTQREASDENAQAGTSGSNVATTIISNDVATCSNAVDSDNDTSCSSGDVVDNSVNSQNQILNSASPNFEDAMNLSRDLSVEGFVNNNNCIHDSTPSINVDAEVSLLKDILNGNGNGNNEIRPSNTLGSSSNEGNLQIMSNRLKLEPAILDIESNDVSNNNVVEQNSTERQSNQNDQNDNPSFVSESLVNRSLENATGPTLKKSIFPPISLEFIDSDCITD